MRKNSVRGLTKLSGKPLPETLERSNSGIKPNAEKWVTSTDLVDRNPSFTPNIIYDLNEYPSINPHSDSSCLSRGAILLDNPGEEKWFDGPDGNSGAPSLSEAQKKYLSLKAKYAEDLCQKWVDDTEPAKHIFEDLATAAFIIELWRNMYDVIPLSEKGEQKDPKEHDAPFPGFVDIACGNGVIVYVLLMEGYRGLGFDARRRKTWDIFPQPVQKNLKEAVCIPKPFSDALTASGTSQIILDIGVETISGVFPKDTFIISNHADELTVWTPLMAALSNSKSPLPFLSIPCCSHSLSGSPFRYPPPENERNSRCASKNEQNLNKEQKNAPAQNPQPQSGDLKALRAEKQASLTGPGMYNSTYGCLTMKTMMIAEEVGYDVERTLIPIPSTRNMGVIGGRRRTTQKWARRSDNPGNGDLTSSRDAHNGNTGNVVIERINEIVDRECLQEGSIEAAAKVWVERVKGLRQGQGKGDQPRH